MTTTSVDPFALGDEDDVVPVRDLTKAELARATGLTLATLDKLCRHGLPHRPSRSKRDGLRFDLPECVEWLCQHRAAEAGGEDGDTTADAKRRLALAQAERLEIANRKTNGEFLLADDVRRSIVDNMARLRSALLAIPARLTRQTPEVQADVKAEIVSAINAMSLESDHA